MCGAFGFYKERAKEYWTSRYELENYWEHPDYSFNIRPTHEVEVVVRHSPNSLSKLKFGIEAPWKPGMMLINAMAETVIEKRTFSQMFREKRCLVPADVFYEWQKLIDMKQPWAFSLNDDEVFSFAGIHNEHGFVILTTTPNSLIEPIHHRMPAILAKEDEDDWLNIDTPIERLMGMLQPYPTDKMIAWPISSLINSAKNNFKEVITQVKI